MKALQAALLMKAATRAERFAREPLPKAWPRPRYPHREEVVYYRRLRYFVELVQYIVERDIVPKLPALLDEVGPTRRLDAAGDIDKSFDDAAAAAAKALPEALIKSASLSTALRVSEWSADQFQKQVQRVVKVNLFDDTSGLSEHLELFVSDNVKLIKSLAFGQLADLKGVVTRGARAGLHHTDVAAQIQRQFGVTRNRAALIASDQIGKLNGELNQLRQTNLGVRRYRWSTSLDERVRRNKKGQDHAYLEGTIQLWAKPPIVDHKTGDRAHPGQAIRCRCSAIPIIDDVLADAGLIDPDDVELTHPRVGEQPPLRTPPAILPSSRPPPPPDPPKPPPVPPPPVTQRAEPPVDPAAALRRELPSAAKAAAEEARRLAEVEQAQREAAEAAARAVREAELEYLEVAKLAGPKRAKKRLAAAAKKRRRRKRP